MIKYIKDIKTLIEKHLMSFIVGAGFSRNISEAFPMWSSLLKPMADELYGAGQYSDKTYLDIASEYTRRKGYHEAIDLYVEQQMPYLQKGQDGKYELFRDGVCVDKNPDLSCHKALLAMEVKDIYTFNYDNALEMVGGVDKSNELRRRLQEYSRRFKDLQSQQKEYQDQYEMFRQKGSQMVESISGDGTMQTQNAFRPSDNPYAEINEYVRTLGNEFKLFDENFKEAHTHNLQAFEKQMSLLDNKIALCEKDLKKHYQLICQSYEISITENRKNIYKLHGNLRKPDTKDCFGFDGDGHKQYIITREDYEDYPHKHEAFVDLMKISLLKGSFCLIGFSGDDPNFLAWISWVKDVLDKNPDEGKRASIYFVHVGKEDIPEDKLQLFRNHYITPVVLKDVYGIEQEKLQMLQFLKDISPDVGLTKQYDDLWNSLRLINANLKQDELPDFTADQKNTIDELYELSKKVRVPSQTALLSNIRSWAVSTIYKHLRKNKASLYLPKLAYLTAKDDLSLLPQVYAKDSLDRLMKMIPQDAGSLLNDYELNMARFLLLREHNHQNLIKECAANKAFVYDAAWSMLFHLDFSNAWSLLEDWQANSMFDKLRRELMRALFQELDENTVSHLLQRDAYESLQDYIYARNVLPFVSGLWHKDHNLFNSLRESEKDMPTSQKSYRDVLDDLTNDLLEPDDVASFGTRQRVYGMDAHSGKWEISAKILHLMIELSLPPHVSNVNFFDKKKWIIVCEQLMEVYPYPCLFFSLLYGNDKTLIKKVAQMYIYSPELRSLMPQMLDEMLNALLDEHCPENIRMAIYLGAPIFAKAVPAEQWQDKFYALFERYDWDQYNSEYDLRNQSAFVKSMASMLTDTELARKMALRCLQRGKLIDHFCNSVLVDLREKLPRRDKEISRLLRNLLAQVDQLAHVYVLLNMRGYLPADKLFDKMLACYDLWRSDENLCYAMAYVSKKHPALQAAVRKAVLESKALWETGIHADGSGVSVMNQDFDINRIQASVAFSPEEIVDLYRRMLPSIGLLEQYLPKWRKHSDYEFLFNDWTELMYIMTRFLKKNKAILAENQADYAETLARLENIKRQYRPASIMDNLLDDSHTSDAITSLVNAVVDAGPKSYLNEYSLIANKIILQDSAALNSCLKHLSWVMTKYKRHFPKQQFAPLLGAMFASYEPYFRKENAKSWTLTTAEKDIAEASLIKLAKVYESWGNSCIFGHDYQAWYFA
ncbi:MAG: SIR2 family protein [Bacteroidales bacterium]|nr:SIR2 family protein [Bacteroidales bacterium]